eukprot:c21832_g1_i4 orf=157-1884(+)
MNLCESHGTAGSVTRNQETHLSQEKEKGTHLQQDTNTVTLLQKEAHLQQEANPQVRKEETHLPQEDTQETNPHVTKEETHLSETTTKKETTLQQELKEAHLQQKGKKGIHLEKTAVIDFQEKQKKEAYWQQEQKKKKKNKRRQKQNFMWVKGRHSICLPRPSAICGSVHPRISSPSPIIQGQICPASGEENYFKIWLRSRGEDEACSTLMMGKSSHGRGLFASRPILAGECILRISKHLVITPDNLCNEVKHLLHEGISSCARLALFILAEQYAGQESDWAPYMSCLPPLGALHNTVLWSNDELELIRQSSGAYHQSIKFRAIISEEFAAVQHVLQQCPHIFGQSVTCTNFRHAYAVVNSRAWGVDEGNTVGLVPFVDFFNHDGSCQSFLSFDNEYEYAEVLADRDYTYGEQVFINYGKFGNDILAVTFGFTLEFNPYDQVEVWMGLSQRDVLRKMKLQLLHSHGMPTIRGFGELISLERQASELDGRLARQPFKDVHKELQAMVLLLARVESLIQDYVGAILALEMAEFCKLNRKSVPRIRRKMAEDILDGELRILRSAANWLKHHCIALNSLL